MIYTCSRDSSSASEAAYGSSSWLLAAMRLSSSEKAALTSWLEAETKLVCSADPVAVSKYILALLKKDKPLAELHTTCLDALQEFLKRNTRPFVEKLFEVLKSREYLPASERQRGRSPSPRRSKRPRDSGDRDHEDDRDRYVGSGDREVARLLAHTDDDDCGRGCAMLIPRQAYSSTRRRRA